MASRTFSNTENIHAHLSVGDQIRINIETKPLTEDSNTPGSAEVEYKVLKVSDRGKGIELEGDESPSIQWDTEHKSWVLEKDHHTFPISSITVLT